MKETISSFLRPTYAKSDDLKPFVSRLMIPLSILIFILVTVPGILLIQQHRHYLHDVFKKQAAEVQHDMDIILSEQVNGLAMTIKPIMNDAATIDALRRGDREKLLERWQNVFLSMKREESLTHFYFHDKNRVCLLRVHNPAKHGDLINRFTALESEWSRKLSSGIEIGPMGTFTLRVVQPVIVDNELVGYIELGKEIEDVLKHLHFQSDTQLAVILRKGQLKRHQWEDGMRMLGRSSEWDLMKNSVLIYSSLQNFPEQALDYADHAGNHIDANQDETEFTENATTYRVSMIPIGDVSGKEVGDMILLNNVTIEDQEFYDSVALGIVIGIALAGTLMGFIYVLLRLTNRAITRQEKLLFENKVRMEQLSLHSRTIAWDVDAEGRFTYLSEFSREIIGYESGELLGKPFYDLHPEEGREAFKKVAFDTFARKEPFDNLKNQLQCKDGTIIWVLTNGLPILGKHGELLGYRGNDTDITEKEKSLEQVNTLAFFDSLTSLPNRTLFLDRLGQAMAVSDRNSQYASLLMIDLDNFKTINDILGHTLGDSLLVKASRRLHHSVREGDSIARLGGDEFVVLLLGLGTEQQTAATAAETVAMKILDVLDKPYDLEGSAYHLTASIGITLFQGEEVAIDNIMKQAELAMYKSKEGGKNALRFFDPVMESSLKKRAQIEEEIRAGIENGHFVLYYQPQIGSDGYVCGVEALIRWNHPMRGMVSPAEFIPIAEESGLIIPLGQWVLTEACRQLSAWKDNADYAGIEIAVNVSVRQFSQSSFVEDVCSVLSKCAVDPGCLKLELTESLFVHDIVNVTEKMDLLKARGVRFSLDDFGTGYSSLYYLKRLPFDQLKIDQSFVRDILNDSNDAIICKSTIALAASMGLSVIAEGVETAEQYEMLLSLGCKMYQGYHFGRPMAIGDFERFFEERKIAWKGDVNV